MGMSVDGGVFKFRVASQLAIRSGARMLIPQFLSPCINARVDDTD